MNSNVTGAGHLANAFSPQFPGQVLSGKIFVLPEGVRFESGENSVVLPQEGLAVRAGGHNNEQIFFEHPQFPGWSIYSSSPGLQSEPLLAERPEFRTLFHKVERSRKGIPKPILLLLLLIGLFFASIAVLVLQKDRIVEFVVDRIPQNWEQSWGDKVFESIKGQGTILENSPWEPQVEQITAKLLPMVESTGYKFQFHIMQDTNVNAFAMPGGHVVILTGLLENAGSAEEVAGVLAHEIGHVTERHSMRQILQSAGLLVLVQALFGDTSGLAAVLMEGSRFLLEQKFSRNFEREADDKGWEYLIQANIDPRGMTTFFEKLKEMHQGSGMASMESTMALLNTHPTTDERISRLEEKWNQTARKSGFVEFPTWKDP